MKDVKRYHNGAWVTARFDASRQRWYGLWCAKGPVHWSPYMAKFAAFTRVLGTFATADEAIAAAKLAAGIGADRLCTPEDIDDVRRNNGRMR